MKRYSNTAETPLPKKHKHYNSKDPNYILKKIHLSENPVFDAHEDMPNELIKTFSYRHHKSDKRMDAIFELSQEIAEKTIAEKTIAEATITEATIAGTTIAEATIAEKTIAEKTITEATIVETTIAKATIAETTIDDRETLIKLMELRKKKVSEILSGIKKKPTPPELVDELMFILELFA